MKQSLKPQAQPLPTGSQRHSSLHNNVSGHNAPPTVAMALIACLILTTGFFGLLSIVIPGAALMLLTGFAMILFFVAQYFVWGRWLYRYVVEQEQRATDEKVARGSAAFEILPEARDENVA